MTSESSSAPGEREIESITRSLTDSLAGIAEGQRVAHETLLGAMSQYIETQKALDAAAADPDSYPPEVVGQLEDVRGKILDSVIVGALTARITDQQVEHPIDGPRFGTNPTGVFQEQVAAIVADRFPAAETPQQ